MADSAGDRFVPAEQLRQLRGATGMPWTWCKAVLQSLDPSERSRFIENPQTEVGARLRDPIEDDPAVRPLFRAAYAEAEREVDEWHRQRIAEQEEDSPDGTASFDSRRGLCHRVWRRTKEILRERHGIEWRSPAEMNPGVTFD